MPKRTTNQLSAHAQFVSAKGLGKNSDVSSGHSVLDVIGELDIVTWEDLVVEKDSTINKNVSLEESNLARLAFFTMMLLRHLIFQCL